MAAESSPSDQKPTPTPSKRKTARRPPANKVASKAGLPKPPPPRKKREERKPLWEWIAELGRTIPKEEWDKVPHDGSINYKHYLYGHPKKTLDD